MKLICLNFSANLPQFPAISTKTKYAYYAKNCLPMYLLCLARANIRDLCWIDIVNLFDIRLSAELCALTDDDLFLVILGQQTLTQLGSSEYTSFWMLQTSEQHRSSIQQSDISYLNKQCDHYITIYQYIYIFDIYVFIHS